MKRIHLGALVTFLAMGVVVGCTAGTDDPARSTTEDPLLAVKPNACKKVQQGYAQCLADSDDDYRSCMEQAHQNLVKGMIGDLFGALPIPCVGSEIGARISGICFAQSTSPAQAVACVLNQLGAEALVRASTLGRDDCLKALFDEHELGKKAYVEALEDSALMLAAQEAGRLGAYAKATETCADTYASDSNGCEPVLCNPAKCVCFDAPSCPTLSACGGSKTHITGIVDCADISGSKATLDGSTIACASHQQPGSKACSGQVGSKCPGAAASASASGSAR